MLTASAARIDDLTAAMVDEYDGVVQFARPIVSSGQHTVATTRLAQFRLLPSFLHGTPGRLCKNEEYGRHSLYIVEFLSLRECNRHRISIWTFRPYLPNRTHSKRRRSSVCGGDRSPLCCDEARRERQIVSSRTIHQAWKRSMTETVLNRSHSAVPRVPAAAYEQRAATMSPATIDRICDRTFISLTAVG
jgi:hypothetical protein